MSQRPVRTGTCESITIQRTQRVHKTQTGFLFLSGRLLSKSFRRCDQFRHRGSCVERGRHEYIQSSTPDVVRHLIRRLGDETYQCRNSHRCQTLMRSLDEADQQSKETIEQRMQDNIELQEEIHQMLKTFDAGFIQPSIDLRPQIIICKCCRIRHLPSQKLKPRQQEQPITSART